VVTKPTSIDKLRAEAQKHRTGVWNERISPDCQQFLNAALVMLRSGELQSVTQMHKACTAVVESDFTEDIQLWPKQTAFKAWVAEQLKKLDKQSKQQVPSQPTVTKKPAKRRVSTV
jgi:hypothetical protein